MARRPRTRSRMQEGPPLPQEIVLEILLRAPPKTLIKCICVCREWYSLIKSPSFITSHSKHQSKDYDNKLLFVVEKKKGSYSLLSDNGAAFTHLQNTKIPFEVDFCCSITSRNGLLCVNIITDFGRHIFLWNPSIRRFKSIETVCFDPTVTMYSVLYCLGVDELRNEYKVVKKDGKKTDVYCLSTNSWHTTLPGNNDLKATILNSGRPTHVNGAVHWLAFSGQNKNNPTYLAILSFDFSTEFLGYLSLPTKWLIDRINLNHQDLTALKGMLSFLVKCNSLCYLWLMKEYGVAQSWIKAYTIVPGTGLSQPLGFTNTRKLVYYFFGGRRLMSYDFDSNKSINVGFEKSDVTQVFFDFMENLILLDQGSASMEQALQDYQRTI